MFNEINQGDSIESILSTMEHNSSSARALRKKIEALEIIPQTAVETESSSSEESHLQSNSTICEEDTLSDYEVFLEEYLKFSDGSLEDLISILPSKDDYQYEDILVRLHAESLRVIKEMTEYQYDDAEVAEEAREIILQERKKIEMLQQIMTMEEEVSLDEPELNQIVLVPNINGRVLFMDDLESLIPVDFYDEVYELLGTIIDGTFKGSKRFNKGINSSVIGGSCEVRGSKVRILFRRVNHNTYAVYAVFLKKTNNDSGYQRMLNNCNAEYLAVEDKIRRNVQNPDFMALNSQLLIELWRKLGHSEAPKSYRKENH